MKKIGLIIALIVLVITLVVVTVISSLSNSNETTIKTSQTTTETILDNSTTITEAITTEAITKEATTNTEELYSAEEICDATNNLFKYERIRIGEYDQDFNARIIWTKSIENISNEPQITNIRIKFYDENKELIADYQQRTRKEEYDASNPFHLEPHGTNNATFTIYDDDLPEGKTLANIKYYSIEDIIYE